MTVVRVVTLAAASDTVRSGTVGATLREALVVRVLEPDGRPAAGETVQWIVGSGSITPFQTTTDAQGLARATWTLGTRSGTQTATARVATALLPVSLVFRAEAAPGPVASLRVSPDAPTLAVGETRQLAAVFTDAYGNVVTGRTAGWSSSNPAVATVDAQTGLVRAVAVGSAEVTATGVGRSAAARVTVAGTVSGEDPFDTNTLDRYTHHADVGATWSISGGILAAQGRGEQSVLIRSDVLLQDGWVEAEMDRADEGGLVLRFQDEGNYYLLAVREDGSILGHRNLELFRRTNGQWHLLEYGRDITWSRGTVKRIRFEAVGNRLRGYADDTLVIDVADSGITGRGRVGMRYHDVPETPGTDMARYHLLRWAVR